MIRFIDPKQDQRRKFHFINKLERDLAKINDEMPSLMQNKQKQKKLFDIYLAAKKTKRKYSHQQYTTIPSQKTKVEKEFFTIQNDSSTLIDQQAQTQTTFLPFQINKKPKKNLIKTKLQAVNKINIIPEPSQIRQKVKQKRAPSLQVQKNETARQSFRKSQKPKISAQKKNLQMIRYQTTQMRKNKDKSENKKEKRKFSQSSKINRDEGKYREESKLSSQLNSSSLLQKINDINFSRNTEDNEDKTLNRVINNEQKSTGHTIFPEIESRTSIIEDQIQLFQNSKFPQYRYFSQKKRSYDEKQTLTQTMDSKRTSNGFVRKIQLTTVQQGSQTGRDHYDQKNVDSFSILPNPNFNSSKDIKNLSTHKKSIQNLNEETNFNQLNEQIQRHLQLIQQKSNPKIDQIIQFPEISQLKISKDNSNTFSSISKQNHPIRNNFNQKGLSWITQFFRPKSHFLKRISLDQCIIKKYRNGVYFGQIQDSKKHGFGVIFYYDGRMFEGKFQNDLKNGEGYQQFPDGSKYTGQFQQGTKNGKGTFEWTNGQVYEGQWLNGKKHGSGMWKSQQGQSYIGQWKNGKPQGFGVYVSILGDRYEGQFQNSYKQGLGTERFHTGETYVGEYRKNRPNGKGEYFWTNGNYYKGDFVNHLKHGEGYFYDSKKGISYKGQYKNDKKCGFGQLKYQDFVYVGNFENDYRHGYGELYHADQLKYKGFWVNDVFLENQNQEKQMSGLSVIKQQIIPIQQKINVQKTKARINNFQSVSQASRMVRKLQKSKSPTSKSIQSLCNSQDESGHKRSCGCTRRH